MVKKIAFIIFIFFSLSTAAQTYPATQRTIKALQQVVLANDLILSKRIDSLINALQKAGAEKPQTTTFDFDKYADVIYYSNTVQAKVGQEVDEIPAIKGNVPLPYVGTPLPTLGRPILSRERAIIFTNQPNANYKELTRSNDSAFVLPEEFTIIFRKMPGTDWEAIQSGLGNMYVGFGGGLIRLLNSIAWINKPFLLKKFEMSILHVLFEPEGEGARAKVWLNGIYFGETTAAAGMWGKRLGYGVGIETNSTDFDWFASFFIEKKLTDAERADYLQQLNKYFAAGSLPDYPYASDISITKDEAGNWSVKYNYNGKYSENKAAVKVEWWQLQPDLSRQIKVGSGNTLAGTYRNIKCTVLVTDSTGNSFHPVSSQYIY